MTDHMMVEDLLASLTTTTSQGNCQITLHNNTPAHWGVLIIKAGVKFFYRDGSDYTDGPRDVSLTTGQTATFISDDPKKCVFGFFVGMVVHTRGEREPATFTFQDQVEKPDECLIHETVALAPEKSVSVTTIQEIGTLDRLSITATE